MKTYFGLEVTAHGVRMSDIEALPFGAFWRESSMGSTGLIDPATGEHMVHLHDWESFCRLFIETGKHRYSPYKDPFGTPANDRPAADYVVGALFEVLNQSCGRIKEGYRNEHGTWCVDIRFGEPTTTIFDSGYISAYATGILMLAQLGLVEIIEDAGGRQVVAEVTEAGRALEAKLLARKL